MAMLESYDNRAVCFTERLLRLLLHSVIFAYISHVHVASEQSHLAKVQFDIRLLSFSFTGVVYPVFKPGPLTEPWRPESPYCI